MWWNEQVLSVRSSAVLFTVWYSDLGMSDAARNNAERKVNVQHNEEWVQCDTPLPWWDFGWACLAMQSVFIDSSKTYPGLCKKAIRLVNNGSLYWKLRAEWEWERGCLNASWTSELPRPHLEYEPGNGPFLSVFNTCVRQHIARPALPWGPSAPNAWTQFQQKWWLWPREQTQPSGHSEQCTNPDSNG